ncbi:CHAP domain-containing protein [Nonomuraea wenchangensis]|uniref:CHAP domain-containing protein n=1 Tax=Nonomuraea wenchangensis TaxID=568860 RepID=UPI00371D4880
MTPETQKFIELLQSQLGYAEKAGAYTKFGDWYGKNVEFDADYTAAPWCDMFLSWAAHKLGYEEWMGQFAWTVEHAKWFKKQGAWGTKPKPGAFVFYDWGGSKSIDRIDHVGVVVRVEGNKIITIEGNIDGGVAKYKKRDTSKVVGYGYPDVVKAKLDARAAKKKSEVEGSLPPESGPGTPTLYVQDGSLTAMIPQRGAEQESGARPPFAARPAAPERKSERTTASKAQTTSPKKTEWSTGSPADVRAGATTDARTGTGATTTTGTGATPSPATPGQGTKLGKHAKPSTADTTAATAEPLPTHADASATGPLPAIASPTLIGSTLVAALALLAVAKTRQNRVRAAAAAASPAPRPVPSHRGRRRKRRGAALPVTRPAWSRTLASDAAELVTGSAPRLTTEPATTAGLTAATAADLVATSAADLTAAETLFAREDADLFAAETPFVRGDADVVAAGTSPVGARDARLVAAGGSGSDASPAEQVRRIREARPFDPFADAAPLRRARGRRAAEPDPRTGIAVDNPYRRTGRHAYADAGSFGEPVDVGPFEPCWDTGPMRRIGDGDPRDTGAFVFETGPFQRIVIPEATSSFDAFAPVWTGDVLDDGQVPVPASYRGRRRRQDPPAEEPFVDLLPRGRRHRHEERELVGAISATSTGHRSRGRHRA